MIRPFALLMVVAVTLAAAPVPSGWKLVRQEETPKIFAITDPTSTNLNIKAVVLACEEIDDTKSLQLQLYPTNRGPILPIGASRDDMKEEPRAEIVIDGRRFPILLGFGGDYVVLMDGEENSLPVLSRALVTAMEHGRTLSVHFDLVREPTGKPTAFDGALEVDLTAGEASMAISAVRRECER